MMQDMMPTGANKITLSTLKNVYDKYSALVYGIALEITNSKQQAEQVLIRTFEKVQQPNILDHNPGAVCATLIKLTTTTAKELNNELHRTDLKLKRFENQPMLNTLLCNNTSLDDFCKENRLTRMEAAKKLRYEFNLYREKNVKMNADFQTNSVLN